MIKWKCEIGIETNRRKAKKTKRVKVNDQSIIILVKENGARSTERKWSRREELKDDYDCFNNKKTVTSSEKKQENLDLEHGSLNTHIYVIKVIKVDWTYLSYWGIFQSTTPSVFLNLKLSIILIRHWLHFSEINRILPFSKPGMNKTFVNEKYFVL